MVFQKTSDWIRSHIEFVTGMSPIVTMAEIDKMSKAMGAMSKLKKEGL